MVRLHTASCWRKVLLGFCFHQCCCEEKQQKEPGGSPESECCVLLLLSEERSFPRRVSGITLGVKPAFCWYQLQKCCALISK